MTQAAIVGSPIIAALDVDDLSRLRDLAAALAPYVSHVKVGLQAFTALGPAAFEAAGAHAPVFADLKLHDIPNTVAGAARAAAAHGVALLTVHASGGARMVAAAVDAAPRVRVLGVTVLTSLDDSSLAEVGQPAVAAQAPRLARLAVRAGAGGIVCAPGDVATVREAVGAGPLIVVPGIRPAGADRGDQARVATPASAMAAGADYLVIGRPLTDAADPGAAAAALLAEITAVASRG